jgi:predicted nucleotidyltransferase
MESKTGSQSTDVPSVPSREALQAELLPVPEAAEPLHALEPPSQEAILEAALRYVRGRRGGDLVAVVLVGSGTRRAVTAHSDLDLIAFVKGAQEGHEVVRVAHRLVEIRYRDHKAVEQDIQHVLRLPPLLRKGRVLFEVESVGTRLIERANQRFRNGPPMLNMHERIRLKAECAHWLGKAEDLAFQPATASYLLGQFAELFLDAYFRIRGWWPTAPAETLRFIATRETSIGSTLERFFAGTTLADRLAAGHDLMQQVMHDIPLPPRID